MRQTLPLLQAACLVALLASPALAYIDPGLMGWAFQIGYMLFYGLLAALAFFFRPIKLALGRLKASFAGKSAPPPAAESPEAADESARSSTTQAV